jgi:hypothetical protein
LVPETGGDPVNPEQVYTGETKARLPKWQGWAHAAKAKLDELMNKDAQRAAWAWSKSVKTIPVDLRGKIRPPYTGHCSRKLRKHAAFGHLRIELLYVKQFHS